jgi:hypothetical protein
MLRVNPFHGEPARSVPRTFPGSDCDQPGPRMIEKQRQSKSHLAQATTAIFATGGGRLRNFSPQKTAAAMDLAVFAPEVHQLLGARRRPCAARSKNLSATSTGIPKSGAALQTPDATRSAVAAAISTNALAPSSEDACDESCNTAFAPPEGIPARANFHVMVLARTSGRGAIACRTDDAQTPSGPAGYEQIKNETEGSTRGESKLTYEIRVAHDPGPHPD